jgi:hypothetical protein
MAKKKKPTAKAKGASQAKRAPAKVKVAAKPAQHEVKQVAITAPQTAEPQVPVNPAWSFSPIERVAIVVGGLLLVVGVAGVLQRQPQDMPDAGVKQQTIPMSIDDFKGDPAIQDAIQKQLGGQGGAAPTPQEQHAQSPQATGGSLQAPAGDVQQ